MTDRITVSLDDDTRTALDALTVETGQGQSAVVRRALAFYAANFEAASGDPSANLEQYYQMLSSGEHVLLDVDFLHCFLEQTVGTGDPDDTFVEAIDRVSEYHAREYAARFDDVEGVLEWLSFCGFLTVRSGDVSIPGERDGGDDREGVYHVVFPSEQIRWFMTRFIERSTVDLPVDIEIESGISKTIVTQS